MSELLASSEQDYRSTTDFFTRNQQNLRSLFEESNLAAMWSDDLSALVRNTQPLAKGDHFRAINPVAVAEEREKLIKERFEALRMIDAVDAKGGLYDHIVMLGGTMATNGARTAFALEQMERTVDPVHLKPGGTLTAWVGPRQRMEDKELQPTQAMLETIKELPVSQQDRWLQRQARLFEDDETRHQAIRDETAQGRLSFLRYFGERALVSQIHLRLGQVRDDRLISRYVMGDPDQSHLEVMNALPVSRANMQGEARHTTESCAREWAHTYLQTGSERVLFVSSNPYVQRTTLAARQVLRAEGFSDVQLTGCGPAMLNGGPLGLLFGEVARLLWTTNQERQLDS